MRWSVAVTVAVKQTIDNIIDMGTWGTAIASNDTYADVYSNFFKLYNDGLNVTEISEKLILENREIIDDADQANNFWFALAKAQWECKELDSSVLKKVTKIIEEGKDIEIWTNLEASSRDIEKRKQNLLTFLEKLQTQKEKPRVRKKKKIPSPAFKKGACVSFKLSNGNYGGAVVIEADHQTGYNLIAATNINLESKPVLANFQSATVAIDNGSKQLIYWYYPAKDISLEKIEEINILPISKTFHHSNNIGYGHIGDFDLFIIDKINSIVENHSKIATGIAIKKLIEESNWKFW